MVMAAQGRRQQPSQAAQDDEGGAGMKLYAVECQNCKWYTVEGDYDPYCKAFDRLPVVGPTDVCEYFEEVQDGK